MRIITQSPAGVAGCAAAGLVSGAFWTLAPVFALNAGLDITEVSLFMSVIVMGGALGQWPLGYLSDRHDRRKVLLGTLAVACVLAAIMYLTAMYKSEFLLDRKSVVEGKSVSVRVDLGGSRYHKKK